MNHFFNQILKIGIITGMKIKNYSMNFFGRMNGDFSVSPSEYHRGWRNQTFSSRGFIGPWNYAGASPGSVKSKPQFQGPVNTVGKGSYKKPTGFVSPVSGYEGRTRRKSFRFGDNRTQALSEE